MSWIERAVETLATLPVCGYRLDGPAMTEPTALAAIALIVHDRRAEAHAALSWLASMQADNGSLGVQQGVSEPCWPTSLAVVAWAVACRSRLASVTKFHTAVVRGVDWLCSNHGKTQPRSADMGHDPTLVGWAWVGGTHSWVEPTAMSVLALKAAGHATHPRAREAVRMLIDRLLPGGGCNYGNTMVLGQMLRPHVQPSGLALTALKDETDPSGRIGRSLHYLEHAISADTTASSLAYALIGLAAHGRVLDASAQWLELAAERTGRRDGSPYRLALLLLAAAGRACPLLPHALEGALA